MPFDRYLVIFALVFIDQVGLPLPAAPTLLYVGAELRSGRYHAGAVYGVVLAASLLGHIPWYLAGRRSGLSLLRRLCRLSVEPDACVRRVERLFVAWGPVGLIAARFVPGLDTLAQPLVGIIGMRPGRYLVLTVVGGIAWATVLLGLGWLLGDRLRVVLDSALQALGVYLVPGLVGAPLLLAAALVLGRYRSILGLDVRRIQVAELKARLDANEAVTIFDLRYPLQLRRHGITIPGARRFTRDLLVACRAAPVGEPALVVMFCNCLHEIASARLARTLGREGLGPVFPLEGGLDAWVAAGHPVQPVRTPRPPAPPAASR